MSPIVLRILMQRRRNVEKRPSGYFEHGAVTEPREDSPVFVVPDMPPQFVELDARQNDGYTVSLEWSRQTDATRIVVGDIRTATELVFPITAANAGDAFRHPFRYAP